MLACSHTSKLLEVPAQYGHISAVTNDSHYVYVGTSEGWLLQAEITVQDSIPVEAPSPRFSLRKNDTDERNISSRVHAKERHMVPLPESAFKTGGSSTICQIEVSNSSKPLLYVLTSSPSSSSPSSSSTSLSVWDATEMRYLGQVCNNDVLTFAIVSPTRLCVLSEDGMSLRTLNVISSVVEEGAHNDLFHVAEAERRPLQEKAATVTKVSNDFLCVGSSHGYSFFCITTDSPVGDVVPCSSTETSQDATAVYRSRRVVECDGQLFLHEGPTCVVATTLPTVSTNPEEAPPLKNGSSSFAVTEGTVQAFTVAFPFLFIFTESRCSIFSLLHHHDHKESCQELTSAKGIRSALTFAPVTTAVQLVVGTSEQALWALHLFSLPYLLADLVQSDRVKEASACLCRLASRQVPHVYEEAYLAPLQAAVEVAMGWAHLRDGKFTDAMGCFKGRVDPRSLLRLLPECVPPDAAQYSNEVIDLLQHGKRGDASGSIVLKRDDESGETREESSDKFVTRITAAPDADPPSVVDYWDSWDEGDTACSPERLLDAWKTRCQQLCTASSSSTHGEPAAGVSECPSLPKFLSGMHIQLKVVVYQYCQAYDSQLHCVGETSPGRMVAASKRAVAYALLVLSLERGDHRAVYDLVCYNGSLAVADSHDLLVQLGQYRLLALLLFRRGYWQEAQTILERHVYISRYTLSPPFRQDIQATSGMARATALAALGDGHQSLPGSEDTLSHLCGRRSQSVLSAPMQAKVSDLLHHRAAREGPGPTVCNATLTCRSGCDRDHTVVVVVFPHVGPYTARAQQDLLPNSLANVFYLVEQLDLPALAQVLAQDPAAGAIRDEEGATLLHVAMEWCGVLQPDATRAATTAPVLQSVAALTSLLVAYGCPPQMPTLYGLWPLDVLSVNRTIAGRSGEVKKDFDPVLEFVASILVSQEEIIRCCLPY